MKLSDYYKPTPKRFRVLGDTILVTSTFITGIVLVEFDKLKEVYSIEMLRCMIGSAMVLGVAGKFLSNFFADDTVPTPTDNEK